MINTWSDINPRHAHFKHRVEDVKRGVYQAGGFPIELPALSLAEVFVKPTTMLYRNMLAMETEELIRSHPVDGVLMGGCDKTMPGLVMGAISAGLPLIYMPAGPMLRGNYRGEHLGSGSTLGNTGTNAAPAPSRPRKSASRPASPVPWPLHDHGHGLDHDRHHRGTGFDPARRQFGPGARRGPYPPRLGDQGAVEMVWED